MSLGALAFSFLKMGTIAFGGPAVHIAMMEEEFVATVGIFLPGFLLVAASGPLIPKIRRSALAGAVLDGVIVGSLALMGVVTWQLGRAALVDPLTIAIACVSAVLLFAIRINAAWLILVAAVIGVIHGA